MWVLFATLLEVCLISFGVAFAKPIQKRQMKCLFVLAVIALAGLGACIEPKPIYDLYRHYEVLERVRNSQYSFLAFIKNGHVITDPNYQFTYVFNALIYIVAHYLPNQGLPFITIAITYGVFFYILAQEYDDCGNQGKKLTVAIGCFSVLLPYLFVYSNIRNALAAAIVSYGIYGFYKKKRLFRLCVTAVVAALIHPVSLAIIPFVFLSKIRPGVKGAIVTIGAPLLLSYVLEYFRLSGGNDFMFRVAAKYYNYTKVRVDSQGRVFLLSTVGLLIAMAVISLWPEKKPLLEKENNTQPIFNLCAWFALFALGFVNNYTMILRLPFSIAFFSPVIAGEVIERSKKKSSAEGFAAAGYICLCLALAILGVVNNLFWLI